MYIHFVFPVAFDAKWKLPEIEEFNKKVELYCDNNNIVFLNFFPAFFKNYGLDTSLTIDCIHFNGKGYFLEKKSIEKFVNN